MKLSLPAARALLLAAQGLERRPARAATKAQVLATIQRMSVLQIDTIHVVARSPYLVLWSRLGAYEPRWLEELLAEGTLFEYWAHAACFLPIEDFALYRRRMLERSTDQGHSRRWVAQHGDAVQRVLAHVREHGRVRSADFERSDGQAGGWWSWKVEKHALEHLFNLGELMIAERQKFQRIYALREQVLPEWDDARVPSAAEVQRQFDLRTVRALGVARAHWVADYFRTPKRGVVDRLNVLVDAGELLRVEVDAWEDAAYIHPDNLKLARTAARGALQPQLVTLLSPFDPIVWDRQRARELFNFDYVIECYTPAPKRRFGYFTLPILRHAALIGRLDAKAHRQDGLFEVKAIYLERGVKVDDELIADLIETLIDCAAWHATPQVIVRRSEPARLAARLNAALAKRNKRWM